MASIRAGLCLMFSMPCGVKRNSMRYVSIGWPPFSHLRLVVSDAFLFLPFPLPCQPFGSIGEVGILAGTFSLTLGGNRTYNVTRPWQAGAEERKEHRCHNYERRDL